MYVHRALFRSTQSNRIVNHLRRRRFSMHKVTVPFIGGQKMKSLIYTVAYRWIEEEVGKREV